MLEKFLDYLRLEKHYSPHTVKAYASDLRQLQDYIEHTYPETGILGLEPLHLRSWLADLHDHGLSPRSLHRMLSSVKAYYRWLMKYHGLSRSPAANVKAPKTNKRLPLTLREEELDALLPDDVFPDNISGKRDKAILELLYNTGIRSAELINLKKSSIDYQQGSILVRGKRNKERIIPVGPRLMQLLRAYDDERIASVKDSYDSHFFSTDKGAKLYPKLVYRIVNNYLAQVSSLQKKSPHVLRHSFATHMLNRGADLNAIKELLGHASLAATQVYTHSSIEQLKEVHRKAHPRS